MLGNKVPRIQPLNCSSRRKETLTFFDQKQNESPYVDCYKVNKGPSKCDFAQ
jgi:hypothetical protein